MLVWSTWSSMVARSYIAPTRRQSSQCTIGPAHSSASGSTNCSALRNAPRRKPTSIMAPSAENLTLNISKEIHVRATIEKTFAALLEQMGPHNETAEGQPMPMKIEPWPGGRWYRDLGRNDGHFWGNVQAIKRPT